MSEETSKTPKSPENKNEVNERLSDIDRFYIERTQMSARAYGEMLNRAQEAEYRLAYASLGVSGNRYDR